MSAGMTDSFTLRLIFRDPNGQPVPNVDVVDWASQSVQVTDSNGEVVFTSPVPVQSNGVSYAKAGDYRNGVSVIDLLLIQKHLLGIEPFEESWQFLAADVNRSVSVSALDIIETQKFLLGLSPGFQGSAWRFDPKDLLLRPEDVISGHVTREILVYKAGDVNASAVVD